MRWKNPYRWYLLGTTALGSLTLLTFILPMRAHAIPDTRTQEAMVAAINDEYQARAFYTAVIEKFGSVRPFSNIVRAEDRHVQRWYTLFNQYGLPIPDDIFAGQVEAPTTLQAACEMGVAAEIADAQMYDRFLEFVDEPDLRATFIQLSNVSRNNHQPAFERCVSRWSMG
jgi:hypothetical protein